MAKYTDLARAEGRNYISLSTGMSDHYVCTHCEAWSPGEWGEGEDSIRHKEGCPVASLNNSLHRCKYLEGVIIDASDADKDYDVTNIVDREAKAIRELRDENSG